MKKLIHYFRLLFILYLGLPGAGAGLAARTAPAERGRDPRAIVRSLETRYHSATTWKATFLERYSEGRHDVRVESGTVYFRRPGRMRWEYESPEEKLFVADGRTAWFYVPADHTVSRAPMKESTDWRAPLAWLTGRARLSRLCGRIELAAPASSTEGSSVRVVLRCTPRGEASAARGEESGGASERGESLQEALFEVEERRNELVRVLVRLSGGIEIEYRFGNWQQNLPVPEAMFHFQAPAGVAIVDESSISGAPR
ncbi:MAG: outer membrane lipoprotein carrier protein LolA [Acidobacteria bacterium]|nr:outer membrane lipoprotein carrier protein LolA [Acidobacteriota bacterium]